MKRKEFCKVSDAAKALSAERTLRAAYCDPSSGDRSSASRCRTLADKSLFTVRTAPPPPSLPAAADIADEFEPRTEGGSWTWTGCKETTTRRHKKKRRASRHTSCDITPTPGQPRPRVLTSGSGCEWNVQVMGPAGVADSSSVSSAVSTSSFRSKMCLFSKYFWSGTRRTRSTHPLSA